MQFTINKCHPLLNLIVCYRSPTCSLTQIQWDIITENTTKSKHNILLGDFNAHNTIWNCKKTDSNGEKFINSIDKHNLFIHNDNSLTHIDKYRNTKSNIDLILSSMDIAEKIDTNILDDNYGSDHYPILVTVNLDIYFYKKKPSS